MAGKETKGRTPKEPANFSKGLEGIVAARTALSFVNGREGRLYYRGIEVSGLVKHSTFEEVIYLLFFGELPKEDELEQFSNDLSRARSLPPDIEPIIQLIPTHVHPMSMLRTVVSALALYDPDADDNSREANLRKGLKLVARVPTILAAFDRIRKGKIPIAPRRDLNHAANFLYMLTGEVPEPLHAKALDAYLILLADHGLNASTFAARVTISTLSDLYSALTAAIGTLKGDLHGSANQRTMEMFLEIGDLSRVEPYLKTLLSQKKKVMGFGHRIYKSQDPRAVEFKKIAREVCRGTSFEVLYRISEKLEKIMWKEKKIPCNVDFYSASVLYVMGIPIDLFTTVFAASRVAGWTAQVLEQLADNRLIRPEADYVGPIDQPYMPIGKR